MQMAHLNKAIDKMNNNKGRDKTTSIEGTPLSLQKWGLAFQKILTMRHYQGVTQKFGKMMF